MGNTPYTCHGEEARKQFASCINSFLQDDSTGKAYGVRRDSQKLLQMVSFAGCGFQSIVEDFHDDVAKLHCYEMIVIDSGNSHGDSWIATFYPKQMSLSFVDEHFNQQNETASASVQRQRGPRP